MLRKLFSHTVIYGLAPQIPKIVGILVLPFTTPYLSQLDFGIYGVVTALVAGVSVFGNLGLNAVLGNMFYKSPNHYKWGWRQIYGFLTLWNIPYSIILGLLVFFACPAAAKDNLTTVILLNILPVVLFGATSMLGNAYYLYMQKPYQIAIRSVAIGITTVALNLLFIAHFKMGYLGWFWSAAIGQLLLQFSYWIPLNISINIKPIFNFKWRFIKQNLKVALPTVPHYYGGYLMNSSDRVVMNFLGVSIFNIGLYNAANTVSNPFMLLGTASGQAVAPLLLKTYKDKTEDIARKLVFTLQIVFLIGTFITSVWIQQVFQLLIKNAELQPAYSIAIPIIMAYSYRPMYLGANNRLFYYEKTKVLLKVTFVAGVINLILNITLIPFLGFQVAAYTTFICLMYMGYVGYYLKEFRQTCTMNYYPTRWLLLTIIMTTAAIVLAETNLTVKVLSSLVAIALGCLGVYKLNRKT